MANGPTPEDIAIMGEILEFALSELNSDEREVIDDFRAGFPNNQIGLRRGLSARTVARILRKFQSTLRAMLYSD
jgi:DNA-binding NarL/FixJ family response regulator